MRWRRYKDKKRKKKRHWILYLTGSPIRSSITNVEDRRRGQASRMTEGKKQILHVVQSDRFGVSSGMFMPIANQKKRSIITAYITAYQKTISHE